MPLIKEKRFISRLSPTHSIDELASRGKVSSCSHGTSLAAASLLASTLTLGMQRALEPLVPRNVDTREVCRHRVGRAAGLLQLPVGGFADAASRGRAWCGR